MRYVPWDDLNGTPNIIVDGYPGRGTLLTLSHWRGSGSPEELADDLSTQIAFRYLDRPDLAVDAAAVSNNHFDEDGLCGIYAVLNLSEALARRERIIDVAQAGDFGTFRSRDSARIAFALMAYADADRSPLGGEVFARGYSQTSAALYEETLARLPEMLEDPDRFLGLWEAEDAWLTRDVERVQRGEIRIEEIPEVDLAVVRLPEDCAAGGEGDTSLLGCHQSAVYNATRRHRVLAIRGRSYAVRYRYETWVRYVSAPTMPRVDLAPLAEELTARESSGARWSFDGVEEITPGLALEHAQESAIPPEEFVSAVTGYLRRAGE